MSLLHVFVPQILSLPNAAGPRLTAINKADSMSNSNAHLGISHPFGAPHSANSNTRNDGVRPTRDYTPWVSPNAPLEERMYPRWQPGMFGQSGYDAPSRVIDDYMRQNADAALDPVGTHARLKHEDLRPYTPTPSDSKRYYELGVRPLDGAFGFAFGREIGFRDQHAEYMQLLANNGENFGMLKNSLFSDGAIRADSAANMKKYQVLPGRYNAQLIDRARWELENEWIAKERKQLRDITNSGSLQADTLRRRYDLCLNNCQDYMKQVIDRAGKLATPQNPLRYR